MFDAHLIHLPFAKHYVFYHFSLTVINTVCDEIVAESGYVV